MVAAASYLKSFLTKFSPETHGLCQLRPSKVWHVPTSTPHLVQAARHKVMCDDLSHFM